MSTAALLTLSLDGEDPTPKSQQIYDQIRQLILSRRLAAGARLPSSRALAAELGVARGTVTTALEQLTAEGYVTARRGAGLFVADAGSLAVVPSPAPVRGSVERSDGAREDMAPRLLLSPGRPDMRLFPHALWGRTVARMARAHPEHLTEIGPPFGHLPLRAEIARHLADWRGIASDPARIVITAGAGEAVELALRCVSKPGDRVALEDPGYPPLHRFVLEGGWVPCWLDVGSEGAVLPAVGSGAEPPPMVTVLTPSHQFPLGGTMPLSVRRGFLDRAEATGGWIIEDDFDSEFRYAGRPIPALAGMDMAGRCFYAGSFAKLFGTGLRLGYLVVPEELIGRMEALLGRQGVRASAALQTPLAAFMAAGDFHRHMRKMRRVYAERYRVFQALLREQCSDWLEVPDPRAGMLITALVREGYAAPSEAALRKAGLGCGLLSGFRHRADEACEGLLMGFCGYTEGELGVGIGLALAVTSK